MGSFRLPSALLHLVFLSALLFHGERCSVRGSVHLPESSTTFKSRKFVGIDVGLRPERIGEEACSKDNILVYQGATAPLPNGIPTYTVQILNTCPTGCAVADIHVSCGWFSSARLINPRVFRRLRFDDCLVNDGAALSPGDSLSFQYANTFRYPLAVSSVSCC